MDIISYAKASQTLKGAKKYDAVTVAPGAEDRFETVDERIDYLENKLVGRYEDKVVEIDLKDGTFTNTQLDKDQNLSLKMINKNIYASQGTWESNIIDLGGEWIETKYLKFTQDVAESHSITKEISYSDDGITFSDYELYNAELIGQHRFIKLRLELTSTDEISDTTNYSYEAEGNKDFTFNKDSVIRTDRIVLNTNKKVNAASIKEGYYETDLTGFNRISKVKEVF